MGFFTESEKQSKRQSSVPACGTCKLNKGCITPKMQATGEGRRGVLVVAEAPGQAEDEQGRQLIGDAGQLLRKHMKQLGWSLDRDCWKTNAVCCRPPKNRTPSDSEIEACRPNVIETIKERRPRVILLLGGSAVKSVIGSVWSDVGQIGRWAGLQIPCRRSWLCPTWHPSYVLRDEKNAALSLLFHQHLESALLLDDPAPPPPKCSPELIYDPEQAAATIRRFADLDVPVAFDYECDRLKPDHPDARVVCCSISDGEQTIAFPWVGEAVVAAGEFLHSKTPKIGWNIKFEERWTRRLFGRGVRNWVWDGMQAAHVLNNQSGITSLKFQAFVRLGVPYYASTVDGYFKSPSSNEANQIRKADLGDLMRYCGQDSFYTHTIGVRQMKEMERGKY